MLALTDDRVRRYAAKLSTDDSSLSSYLFASKHNKLKRTRKQRQAASEAQTPINANAGRPYN